MHRFPSLKSNREFQEVYKGGKSLANRDFVMYIKKNGLSYNRLGISVSKKVGNSVVRHTFMRKIREIFRLNTEISKGYDIIVIVKQGTCLKDYANLNKSYLHLCHLHRIII